MTKWRLNIIGISYFCIAITLLLIINSAIYTHVQKLPNGRFVVHAHPYNKNENPPTKHEHSDGDILIITNITILYYISKFLFFLIRDSYNKINLKIIIHEIHLHVYYSQNTRGPPIPALNQQH